MNPTVAELWTYPIKSCAGVRAEQLQLGPLGPAGDRRWVVVCPQTGKFLSLRDTPQLSQVQPNPVDRGLLLTHRGNSVSPLRVDERDVAERAQSLTVWGSTCAGLDAGDEVAQWLSQAVGRPCRLWRFDDVHGRKIVDKVAPQTPTTGFADAFPLLVLTVASVAHLNERLTEPIDARRFRANVLIDGAQAHAEDAWQEMVIGNVRLSLVKPCARCKSIKVDPDTATVSSEPMRTMLGYRKTEDGVMFGVNALHHGPGILRQGDRVELC